MAKKKHAPADGASTTGTLQASWPFPALPGSEPTSDTGEAQAADQPAAVAPVTERIHVDAINLYTDPTKNVVERVELQQLFESPFNPRKRYNEAALEELASTIRGVGVMQPILVRPVNMPVEKDGQPVATYEIVFGHRRFRAAKLALETFVPVIVRDLTDAQSAQLQAIENVQRKDLDPIDEALGYANYIEAHGVSKDQLAAEIGLSRTHVYGRLKLLNAVPAVRQAVQDDEIGSEVALLISRIHTAKLQEKALASLKSNYIDLEDGGQKSYRKVRDFLKERFTLNLKEALFDTQDEHLLANAGACAACPKRSGNAPEFSDITQPHLALHGHPGARRPGEPNLCTDPDCFEAKKKAHLRSKAADLQAKGKTVIEGGKARTAIGADGTVKGGFISLKEAKAELAKIKGKKKGDAPAVLQTVVIQNPRDGKTVEAVKVDDLKAAGVVVKDKPAGQGRTDYAAEERKRQAERHAAEKRAAVETKINCAILTAVRAAAAALPRSAFDLQMVAMVAVAGVEYHSTNLLATLHGFKDRDQLRKKVGQMTVEQLTTLMLDCALVAHVQATSYRNDKPEALLSAAKHYGVDVASIRKEVAGTAADTHTQDLLTPQEDPQDAEDPAED